MPTPIMWQYDCPIKAVIGFSGEFGGTGNRFPIDDETGEVNTSWCICDGITTNGRAVPDLRGLFIRGADTNYPVGSTGGSERHEHQMSGTVGSTTLTESTMPSHDHPVTWGIYAGSGATRAEPYEGMGASNRTGPEGGSRSHTHPLSSVSTGQANNVPPFYALAYIMRCA